MIDDVELAAPSSILQSLHNFNIDPIRVETAPTARNMTARGKREARRPWYPDQYQTEA